MQATFEFNVDTKELKVLIPFAGKRLRSRLAQEMNKATTDARREVVEFLMDETGLKRKTFNEAMGLTRANPAADIMEARINVLFNQKRLRLGDYPHMATTYRGRPAIKMLNKYYTRTIKTGFMSADGSRIRMRSLDPKTHWVTWDPYGRSVKGLVFDYEIRKTHEPRAIEIFARRMTEFLAIKGVLSER